MTDNPNQQAADFVRRINVAKHEQQISMIYDLFEQGRLLEKEFKEKTEQILQLQNRNTELQGALSEQRRDNSDHEEKYGSLLMKFGVSEHNTSEYKKRISELLEQLSNRNLTSESSSPRHTDTEPLETNKCNPPAYYAEKLSPRSELYKIDVKFSGQDKSLYPSFQRHIRIALAQNADL